MILLEILYLFSAGLLAVYGLNSFCLTWLHQRRIAGTGLWRKAKTAIDPTDPSPSPRADYPRVTIQLPIYNELHVVGRLIEAVVRLDWPTDRLQIQILDDSTDETQQIITDLLAYYRANNPNTNLVHLHRADRSGFKAGALQAGLASATGEFIAIFDADFVPPSDFLKRTIPLFDQPNVGCVQTRWGHVNPDSSYLTKTQALGIDGHFVIEQAARNEIRAFLNFNGTAGVWRRSCMLDAGGWQGDTLTEDLDLSYRAQLRNWRIAYQAEVIVPAELPVQIHAFKRQQFRWAKGSIQTACKLLGSLWRSHEPLWLKVMATLHLTNYSVHPLMLLNLLLTLPMMGSTSLFLRLTPFFTMTAVGPPLLYWTTLHGRSLPLSTRIGRLGLLMALGTGLSLSNTRAVLEALLGIRSDFKRTPKFAVTNQSTQWQASHYILSGNPIVWLELLLAIYAFVLLSFSLGAGMWWLMPWLVLYTVGYGYVAGLAFMQAWQTHLVRSNVASLKS